MKLMNGKVAIVTGGGTGIGHAVCRLLARKGASVAVVYSRSEREAEETVQAITIEGGNAFSVRCDVAVDREAVQMVRTVCDTLGPVDYLVNNAGITRQLPFAALDAIEDGMWDDLMAVNVKGAFHVSRAVAPVMQTRPEAAIINVGSIAGETGYGSSLPYAVSKAATHGLTRSLAKALAPRIRVNAVAPGAVDTRWWAGNEDKMHKLAGQVALNRVASPEDIAEVVLLLLRAKSMTGQIVRTDNGQTL